ncbi:hypothetical protein [Streptomyces xanthophaeus]|uniref:hypothetical protein n=1 Tax=Streptomyces xanthophaeus TaxID=67385 RepID=UPI0026496C43|nr:hypothetical protein [Streptomyces xanthophaeus]WKD35263.1 hypothetical protein KO717_27240 [Streptomyces xanthophaeus]
MRRRIRSGPESLLPVALALALVAMASWAAWLGWDQHRDVQPDGTETGPYEAWQVLGLGLTLLVPVCWAAYRGLAAGAVVGVTAGLTCAAFYDWSDDASGLFVIGVGMVMVGSLAVTAGVCALINAVRPKESAGRRNG